uniref:Uncharacterized protein n=2 Tax=Cucumis sativus TaxID=3659 RepID=A0A0A0KLC5_CUCSA
MGIDPVTHNPRLDLLDLSSILGSSFYNNNSPNSQMNNFSRLIGIHNSTVNPEVLRFANSFIASNNLSQNPNFLLQNIDQNQEQYSQMIISQLQLQQQQQSHHQIDQSSALPPLHEVSAGCSPSTTTSYGGEPPYYHSSGHQLLFPSSSNFTTDFYSQNCQHPSDKMPSINNNLNGFNYSSLEEFQSYDLYGSHEEREREQEQKQFHEQIMEASPETSTLNSSPTPLNSNSTYFSTANGNGTDQDDRESYCSQIFKFEFSDFLDVNPAFM